MLDVFTAWSLLPVYVLPVAVLAVLGGLVYAARLPATRSRHLILAGIVGACFAVHLAYAIMIGYEAKTWSRTGERRAAEALGRALATFDGYARGVSEKARAGAENSAIVEGLKSGDRVSVFAEADRIASRLRRKYGTGGITVRDAGGVLVAWSGDLPNYLDDPLRGKASGDVVLRASTAYYWLEASAAVATGNERVDDAPLGWVSVFRAIDTRYPNVLPGEFGRTLSEDLTQQVGPEVSASLGESGGSRDADQVSADLRMPDGSKVGSAYVRSKSFESEKARLTGEGLLLSALLAMAGICSAALALARRLMGTRFSKASPRNVLAFICMIWGARLGFAMLRDALHLGSVPAFTSYEYATQMPLGILRSPADLAITAVVAGLSLAVAAPALMRLVRSLSAGGRSSVGEDAIPRLALGIIASTLASAVALAADLGLRRILADASPNPFTASPFDLAATSVAIKVGLAVLTGTCVAAGSFLIAIGASLFRVAGRHAEGRGSWVRGVIVAACVFSILATAAVIAGAGAAMVVTAAVCLAGGLVLAAAAARRFAPGILSVVVALALAASIVQYPHAVADLVSKQKDAVESTAARMAASTDEWKMSMLEEALAQFAEDRGVGGSLAAASGPLDSEAMRLWATSILSRARVVCGVHIMDRDHREVGRFSLEDVGDVTDIEGPIRAARFSAEPTTFVLPDLYVGIAPVLIGDTYLGSVVISIPYRYDDPASWAGGRPTLLEALGGARVPESPFGGGYSASLILNGAVSSTTDKDFEIGSPVEISDQARWVEQRGAAGRRLSYLVPLGVPGEAMLLSFKMLSPSERAVYLAVVVLANMLVALMVIVIAGVAGIRRMVIRRMRGLEAGHFRWSFAAKLALAFLAIAIAPTLILGTASRSFLRARFVEVMESKAEESLNLTRLALERLAGGEASRLARNPILIDELREEPSILGILVTNDFSAAVVDSAGDTLASFGDALAQPDMLRRVAAEGRQVTAFSADGVLLATSAAPIRDVIFPGNVTGCAFASRVIDDALARRLASDLATDMTFFSAGRVAASSRQELFASEIMPQWISSGAYVDCFLRGREIHFSWQRVGNADVVIGYRPLRDSEGMPVAAVSVPLVARKDAIGQRLEWTSTAISYLVAIVIGGIFVLGLVLARKIANPIRDLTRAMLRVSSGDLDFTVPKPGDDEIGDLVTSFNRMTAALDKSRNALTERKRYMETIISNVGAGIISTDWRGRVQTFNSAAEGLLKVRARDVTNRDAASVLRKIGAAGLAAALDEVEGAVGVVRREFGLAAESGTVITVRAVASVVRGPRRRVMGKVIVFEDVTELIRSKTLVAWSEMARQVAHEIKNPLTPMKLSAQQILQAHRDGSAEFDKILEESLATIVSEIEALRRIAVEFSQFSRMPERKVAATGVNQVIEESVAQYERVAGEGLSIATVLDPSVPRLALDRDEIKRVFVNVIENAIQAMPAGGRLEVRSAVVDGGGASRRDLRPREISKYAIRVTSRPTYAEPLKRFVEVSFTDTGSGISRANSEKLFGPNFSTKTHGSGLGLVISKGAVDAYGGEIVIESTEGVGTCVRVRLPLAEQPPTQRPRPRRRYSRWRRRPR